MKNSMLLLLGGLGLFALSQQASASNDANVTTSTPGVFNDNLVPNGTISNILNAPNAGAALTIGNNYLESTARGSPTGITPTNPTNEGNSPSNIQSPAGAAAVIANTPSLQAVMSNPFANAGGQYPRIVDGIYIANPNVNEELSQQWMLSHTISPEAN